MYFKNISIYSSKKDKRVNQITLQLVEILKNLKLNVLISDSSSISKNLKIKRYSDRYILNNSDLMISIGGDGTLLSSARKFGSKGLPLLGINLGNLGFLTDIAPNELTTSINEVISGNFNKDRRILLNASINRSSKKTIALNEVVIHSGAVAQLIEYELYLNEEFVFHQRADGLIVSTSTGSTAYSLSGNGPIVHPDVRTITLLPMFPHSLNARSLIVDEDSKICVRIVGKRSAKLSLDSHNFMNLNLKDEVDISKTDQLVTLIHPLSHNFFSACRTKLGWSLGMSNSKET